MSESKIDKIARGRENPERKIENDQLIVDRFAFVKNQVP